MRKRIISGLLVICIFMSLSLSSCGKSKEAQVVDDLIANIGTVDLENGDARILDAEEALEALSDKDQQSLENLEKLHEARNAYEELLAESEELVISSAKEIEDVINEIGTVNLSSHADIQAALEKYNEADTAVQEAVTNYDDLVEADIFIGKIIANYIDLINYLADRQKPVTLSVPVKGRGGRDSDYHTYALTVEGSALVLKSEMMERVAMTIESITFFPLEDTLLYGLWHKNANVTANDALLQKSGTYIGPLSYGINVRTLRENSFDSPNGTIDFIFGDKTKRTSDAAEKINQMLSDMKVILAELPLDITLRDLGIAGLD
ncbi:MAG TPA: hypothetical protein DIW17_18720 [Clostridiales bacterium]|nr:hypothetical protein [Clostridiales bacterium]